MRPTNLPIILCASIALTLAPLRAQQVSNDPSDAFLSAFSAFQKAEKTEASGNTLAALTAYKDAARILESISQRWPQWNPAIVEFRKKRTADAILKAQEKMARNGGGSAVEATPGGSLGTGPDLGAIAGSGSIEPPLPGDGTIFPDDPMPEPAPSIAPRAQSAQSGGNSVVSMDPIKAIQEEMNRLHRELEGTKIELEKIRKEKEDSERKLADSQSANQKFEQQQKILQQRSDVSEAALLKALSEGAKESDTVKKLQAEAARARKELKDAQIEREAAEEVRQQIAGRLSSAQKRIATLTSERDAATKLSSEASTRIAEARKQMELAIKERELLNEKLSKVTNERDDALTQVAKMKESQKQVDRLISENSQLMAKLEDAEKQITQFKADGAEKDKVIVDLQKEVGSVKQQLANTQKQSQDYQLQMTDLKTKLEATAQELAQTKTDPTGTTERKKMQDENDLLRGIVLRQMKEQARRDQTTKLVLNEMAKMEVKSKDLLSQINYLGQPVVKLTDKERALFKKAQIDISETEISISAPKPGATEAAGGDQPADGSLATNATAAGDQSSAAQAGGSGTQTPAENAGERHAKNLAAGDVGTAAPQGTIPKELLPLVNEAKEQFDHSNYRDAEKTYEKILAKSPNNLYALSNIGVARFRSGKLKQAEESLKKALTVSPEDAFAHCTLGIVYYSQGKYDEAVNELTKALAINPKNAIAHNYLGITASQKGWQDAALKELETATTLDPAYADAHFNLAVVFASQQPPNKENGRRYYKRATELGAEPDSTLEAMLK